MLELSDRYRHVKEICIFLLILAALLAFLAPAHRHISGAFTSFENVLRETIRSETGLDISFDSASPNIFRNLVFHSVTVSSAEDGAEVLRADRVTVSLRLLKLLRGDFFGCIRSISVEGGSLSVDAIRGGGLAASSAESEGEGSSSILQPSSDASAASIGERLSDVIGRFFESGVELNLRNFDVNATVAGAGLSVQIGNAGIDISDDTLSVDSDLSLTAGRGDGGLLDTLSAKLSVSGELASDLSSGFASLSIDSVSLGNFYLSRVGLVAGLQDGVISVTSMQEGQPLSLSATLDSNARTADASLSCEDLSLFRWLSSDSEEESAIALLQDSELSGAASLSYSEDEGLGYKAAGSLSLPEGLLNTSGGELAFDLSGDKSHIDIERLTLLGDDFDAEFSGGFSFETLMPDGLLSVRKLALGDGALDLSGDISIDSSGKTAALSIPELNINRAAFYGVEGTADLSSEGQYEFSLSASDDIGGFSCEGVLSRDSGDFLQLYGAFDSLSIENVAALLPSTIVEDEAFATLSEKLEPYALTTEVYCSTDFERFSYNSPRLILASQEEDGLYLIASVNGTESSLDITDISASPAGIPVSGNVYTMFGDGEGVLFSSDFSVAGLPYTLSGSYADGTVSAYGDYGISFLFNMPNETGEGDGSIFFSGLPVKVGPALLSLSLDANFAKREGGSWGGNINSFSMEEISGLTLLNTVLSASGVFDSSGVSLRNVSLSDELSSLSGFASIGLMSDSVSDSKRASLDLRLSTPSADESISASGSIVFGGESDTLFEGQVSALKLPLMRFSKGQQSDNFISADISLSGSPDMMLASVNIPESSIKVGKSDLSARARAMYEDGNVIVRDTSVSWNSFRVSNVHADFSTETLSGSAGAALSGVFANSSFSMDLQADFQGRGHEASEEDEEEAGAFAWLGSFKELARSFTAGFELSGIRWRDYSVEKPLYCSVEREPGVTAVYAGPNDELSGLLLDDGAFTLSLSGGLPLAFQIDGNISDGNLDVDVSGVDIDIARIWPVIGWPIVSFDSGHLTGGFHIGGYVSDPDFDGALNANDIVVRAPDYFPDAFDPASFVFVADGKEVHAPLFTVSGNGGIAEAEASVYFNRWIPDEIDVMVRNVNSTRTKVDIDNKYFRGRGDGFCDISFKWTPDLIGVTGDLGFENGNFAIRFENFGGDDNESTAKKRNIVADLNVNIGRKVEFRWPSGTFPVMRALLQADEPFHYTYDSINGTYSFKGAADLKGGDIFYFKRSFYLRNGRIVFDEREGTKFDPRISIQAEVRERDENGSPVRITMTVDDDPLSSFNPVFTSDPLKNPIELMEILGQVVTADTSSDNSAWRDLAVTGTDLLAQFGLLRPAENFIRDKLHLDIFSVRTLILQNAIFGNSTQGVGYSNRWTAGNFLDNTTVYIGKYIGSAVYVDALLQFSYYDSAYYQDRVYTNTFFPVVFGNLLVLPEIGVELDTPFAHIRWGISPVPSNNNITLSWRFSY